MKELISKANQKFLQRDYAAALPLYKQIIQEYPESAKGYLGLACCYSALNLFDQALNHVDKVIQLDPSLADPYYVLSDIAWRRGEIKNLFKYSEKAYALAPDSCYSMLYFGSANVLNGNPEKGIEILENGKRLDPNFFEIRQSLHMSYVQQHQWGLAQTEAQAMYQLQPSIKTRWMQFISFSHLTQKMLRILNSVISGLLSLLVLIIVFCAYFLQKPSSMIITGLMWFAMLLWGIKIIKTRKFLGVMYIVLSVVLLCLLVIAALSAGLLI